MCNEVFFLRHFQVQAFHNSNCRIGRRLVNNHFGGTVLIILRCFNSSRTTYFGLLLMEFSFYTYLKSLALGRNCPPWVNLMFKQRFGHERSFYANAVGPYR